MTAAVSAWVPTHADGSYNLARTEGQRLGAGTMGKQWLTMTDVTRIWGEQRARQAGLPISEAKPVSRETVSSYLKRYREGQPGSFGQHPMPPATYPDPDMPRRRQPPMWLPEPGETIEDLENRFRAWWDSRPGPGVGGGRPRKDPPTLVECACGTGAMVAPGTICDQCASPSGRRRGGPTRKATK